MAIGADSLIELTVNMLVGGSQTLNVWQYVVSQHSVGVEAIHIAEAWWNQVKTPYRALAIANYGSVFQSVRIRELNDPAGDYAEFDVPSGEQAGNRTNPADVDVMPYHVATAVRMTVGTRLTRPGQKRFPFATQTDIIGSAVQPAWKTLVTTLMNAAVGTLTLGAPAALEVLDLIVCRKDGQGTVTASQKVSGFLVANYASSQNSRKIGRGV